MNSIQSAITAITAAELAGQATEPQLRFLTSLNAERETGMSPEDFAELLDVWRESGILTKRFASELIEEYSALPKSPRAQVEPGYYAVGKEFAVVVKNKAGTGTYAKVLTKSGGKVSWEYRKGFVLNLRDMKPLTVKEAGSWGSLHGVCMICCRPLTDVASVTAGIGPVCAKRLK